jgi:hypothetical protein
MHFDFQIANDEIADLSKIFSLAGQPLNRNDVTRHAVISRHSSERNSIVNYLLIEAGETGYHLVEFKNEGKMLFDISDKNEWEELKLFCEASGLLSHKKGREYKFAKIEGSI